MHRQLQEVQARRERVGLNRLAVVTRRPVWLRFMLQFHNILIYVLIGCAVVTAASMRTSTSTAENNLAVDLVRIVFLRQSDHIDVEP